MNSPSAEARALSLVAPLPLVKHIWEWASRRCRDQTLGTMLRQEAISIFMPMSAISPDRVAMVCSSGTSLPGMQVRASAEGAGIQILYHLDDEFRPGLHHLLHCAAVDGAQYAQAVLLGDVLGQLDLDLEGLLVAVLRIDDVVLRQADVFRGNATGLAVELDEIGRTERRGGQEVIEGTGRRAIALVADRLIGDYREVVEFGLETKVVEEVDLDFHAGTRAGEQNDRPLSGFSPPGSRLNDWWQAAIQFLATPTSRSSGPVTS